MPINSFDCFHRVFYFLDYIMEQSVSFHNFYYGTTLKKWDLGNNY